MTGKFIPRKPFILLGHMLLFRDFSDTSVWNYTGTFSKSIKFWFSGSCLSFLGRNPEQFQSIFKYSWEYPGAISVGLNIPWQLVVIPQCSKLRGKSQPWTLEPALELSADCHSPCSSLHPTGVRMRLPH